MSQTFPEGKGVETAVEDDRPAPTLDQGRRPSQKVKVLKPISLAPTELRKLSRRPSQKVKVLKHYAKRTERPKTGCRRPSQKVKVLKLN